MNGIGWNKSESLREQQYKEEYATYIEIMIVEWDLVSDVEQEQIWLGTGGKQAACSS